MLLLNIFTIVLFKPFFLEMSSLWSAGSNALLMLRAKQTENVYVQLVYEQGL